MLNTHIDQYIAHLKYVSTYDTYKHTYMHTYVHKRRAIALNKMGRNVEARGMCMGGLALEKDNKELRTLRDQVRDSESVCLCVSVSF